MLTTHIECEERRWKEGEDRMNRIEQDLRPLNKIYHAMIGAGTVGGLLIAGLIFVYQEDRGTLRNMVDVVYKQGTALEKLLARHEELERDTAKEFQRVEKAIERLHAK